MQVQRASGEASTSFNYRHLGHAVYRIGRDEGLRALLNGSLARIMFQVPNVAITISLVEVLKPKVYTLLADY